MALSLRKTANAIPIAKIYKNNRSTENLLYLLPHSISNSIIETATQKKEYVCPNCQTKLHSKTAYMNHIRNICKDNAKSQFKAEINLDINTTSKFFPIPNIDLKKDNLEHEIIFVSGPPKCGKSYFVNEYVKIYNKILPENDIFLITTHEQDDTLTFNNYKKLLVDDQLCIDSPQIQEFENSLVVFDDIESSRHAKGTKYCWNLLDDINKNGRHYNISVIITNQECRMGKKTKGLLSMMSKLVIFPSCGSRYQYDRLLKEHLGFNIIQLNKLYHLPFDNDRNRFCLISRTAPQYVLTPFCCYMLRESV